MADHSKPTNSSLYTDYTTELDARFDDLAVGLDPAITTATNIPTNTIRWNSANSYWEKYNGSTWAALDTGYEIDLAGARKILTNSASPALTITQTGTGNALVVEDSASPDATPFVIDAAGNVGIGTNSLTDKLTIRGSGVVQRIESAGAVGQLSFYRNNGSFSSPTVVVRGSGLLRILAKGYDGANYIDAASIDVIVDETPGTNDMPSRLTFSTTADGSDTPTERMRIDSAGRVGIGGTPTATAIVYINNEITGATAARLVRSNSTVLSDVTSEASVFLSNPATQAAIFTLGSLFHFSVTQGTFGAGSSVTNQYGYVVNSNVIGATNNYGFYSNIPSGTGRWNFYANGTANNAFAGNTRFGGTTAPTVAVDVTGAIKATGNIAGGYVAHAAGTTAMAFGSYNVVRVTPNANATYTTTVPAAGSIVVLSILTSGTSSYTITFGTGFKSTGTLATGTTDARYFNLTFVSDGTNLIETARTVAIA